MATIVRTIAGLLVAVAASAARAAARHAAGLAGRLGELDRRMDDARRRRSGAATATAVEGPVRYTPGRVALTMTAVTEMPMSVPADAPDPGPTGTRRLFPAPGPAGPAADVPPSAVPTPPVPVANLPVRHLPADESVLAPRESWDR